MKVFLYHVPECGTRGRRITYRALERSDRKIFYTAYLTFNHSNRSRQPYIIGFIRSHHLICWNIPATEYIHGTVMVAGDEFGVGGLRNKHPCKITLLSTYEVRKILH